MSDRGSGEARQRRAAERRGQWPWGVDDARQAEGLCFAAIERAGSGGMTQPWPFDALRSFASSVW